MTLIEDIKKPFNIIMLAIALIAIVLSIIFYLSSIKNKEPVYSISETQLQIFNSNLSTDNIKVFDKSENQIKNNIYVTTIAFWNVGQLGIDSSDVRKPINIMLTNGAKLIDYKIIKAIHPEIAHYSLSTDTTDQNEKIILSWSYLDAGFGVEIQIMYSNSEESQIKVDGYISESNMKKVKVKELPYGSWSFFIIVILSIYNLVSLFFDIKKERYRTKYGKGSMIMSIVTLVLGAFIFLLYFFSYKSPF